MHAEEVDLCDLERLVADADFGRDAADGCDELPGLGGADADMPFFLPAGRLQSPILTSAYANCKVSVSKRNGRTSSGTTWNS
mgnify:CR=1 FL=1